MSSITFHTITEHVPSVQFGQLPKAGRRAPELPAHLAEIAAEVPEVADALSTLDDAVDALRRQADAMDSLSDEHEDYRAKYRATAIAGKVPSVKPNEFWQARADEIREAHAAVLPSAVDAQTALVALAAPYVAAHVEADRARIVRLADELAVLIGRSTSFAPESGIVVNFVRAGTVGTILAAIRHIGRTA
jgi:hypothetical protein